MSNPNQDIDVTDQVKFHGNDDESLPLMQCVCGRRFIPWAHIIGIYREDAIACPECKRRLYFDAQIRVYEVRLDA